MGDAHVLLGVLLVRDSQVEAAGSITVANVALNTGNVAVCLHVARLETPTISELKSIRRQSLGIFNNGRNHSPVVLVLMLHRHHERVLTPVAAELIIHNCVSRGYRGSAQVQGNILLAATLNISGSTHRRRILAGIYLLFSRQNTNTLIRGTRNVDRNEASLKITSQNHAILITEAMYVIAVRAESNEQGSVSARCRTDGGNVLCLIRLTVRVYNVAKSPVTVRNVAFPNGGAVMQVLETGRLRRVKQRNVNATLSIESLNCFRTGRLYISDAVTVTVKSRNAYSAGAPRITIEVEVTVAGNNVIGRGNGHRVDSRQRFERTVALNGVTYSRSRNLSDSGADSGFNKALAGVSRGGAHSYGGGTSNRASNQRTAVNTHV